MTRNDALMIRARRINPVPPELFVDYARTPGAEQALRQILQTPVANKRSRRPVGAPPPQRKYRTAAVRTTALIAALGIIFGISNVRSPDQPRPPEDGIWSAELLSIAEQSPRLLLPQEEWTVTRADELSAEIGEMTFENGKDCTLSPLKEGCYWMSLIWRPADSHSDYFRDRKRGSESSTEITIDGREAAVFEVNGTAPIGKTFYAMWLDDDHSLELRSDVVPTLKEFTAIASTLHRVDVETWLSAMPASVVKPGARDDVIDRVIADIPIPDNIDLTTLRNAQNVRDSQQLKSQVVETIVCGWVQQWIDGTHDHDEAVVREAVAAMSGARDWRILKSYETYGARDEVLDVADAMLNGTKADGEASLPTGVGYQRHLGCPEN